MAGRFFFSVVKALIETVLLWSWLPAVWVFWIAVLGPVMHQRKGGEKE